MREVNVSKITEAVKKMSKEANFVLEDDVLEALKEAKQNEESPTAREILDIILENDTIAEEEQMPMCQDTGVAVVFAHVGEDVKFTGGEFEEAIHQGVREGYEEGYLRKSLVKDPVIERDNTGDNTPAVIHTRIVPGDEVELWFAPKGGGSENMSSINMMKAADGIEGVKDWIVEKVEEAGGNPCPPIVVGIGLGGTFEKTTLLAKKALLREIGERSSNPQYAEVEKELLERINKLGIGPMGLGGRTTALDVFIESHPCHIASMPVAINIQCHAARHKHKKI